MLLSSIPSITNREFLTTMHGMLLGGIFLLAYSGGMVAFFALRSGQLTPGGVNKQLRLLRVWVLSQAAVAWIASLAGAFIVYPWYRAKPPAGANLADYPQKFLMASPSLSGWHSLGMEWKEHVAWFAPILATCVAYIVIRFGRLLTENKQLRSACMILYTIAFSAAAIAGIFGAEITKAAPIH